MLALCAPDGLLLAQGEEWKLRRKIVSPVFSSARIKQVCGIEMAAVSVA